MKIARLAWYPTFAIALGIFILSIPKFFSSELGGIAGPRYSDISSPLILSLIRTGIAIMLGSGLLSLYLALLLFHHRSSDRTGLLTSFFLLTYGVIMTGSLATLESFWPRISFLDDTILSGIVNALALFLFAIFPDGKFIPRWARWVVLTAFLIIPISLYFYSFFSEPPIDFSRPEVMLSTALILILYVLPWFSILYAQVHRYRLVSTQQQKQQTKWVVYGLGIYFSLQIIGTIPYIYLFSLPLGSPLPPWQPVADIVYALTIAIIPATLTIAVMRYRLYDIDIIINRTLVYGTLTAIVIVIYGLIVGLVGAILHAQGNLLITLLATGVIAVLFQPLRERLQRTVNRLIYGERDNPIEALSRLGKQMEVALPSDQVLPALVKTIAQTLKLPYVGITQKGQTDISFGQETDNPVSFPFTFQGETTGILLASPRSPSESFSSAETRLLQNLARQAGVVVRNAQLTADLQRSRQTLVTAREDERHRLRRDLHDGIGPTMAGLTLKLDAARDLVSSNLDSGNKEELEEAIQLLSELKTQTQETVQNIRHIVHALRPPSLDVLGLVPALQSHFGQVAAPRSLNIQMITTPQSFPRFSAAVEVAIYRIVLEAVTNVINHAQAEICEVSLILKNGNLKVEIKDDGMGLPRTRNHGIGLDSMRERAEELDGRFELVSSSQGTHVCAVIPVASPREK
jgi:signal transduction histidine kinase